MSRYIKFFSLTLTAILLCSCAKKLTEVDTVKLPRRKTQDLVSTLDSLSQEKPNFFYTKIATSFSDTNRNINFKTSIRMVKDSAINTLITYAKIPIINSMITVDSVKVINKRDKCYIIQSLGYIKDNFGIDFNYKNLEELILGLPLAYDTTQKYFQMHDPHKYIISSHKKRDIKRVDRNERQQEKEDIIVKYFLTPDGNGLSGMHIESPSDTTTIQVDYLTREMLDGFGIPKDVFIKITSPRNQMRIEMSYDKAEINMPQPLFFVIPEEYEKCE